MNGNRGFALVITLLVTALMVAAAGEMIHQVYVDTALSRGFRDGQQASLLAESGVTGAARLLQQWVSAQDLTSLSDSWAAPIKLHDQAGSLEVSIREESAKLNLNDLVQPNGDYQEFILAALQRLGGRLKLSQEVWPAVADWIDGDDTPRSGGAESAYYKGLKAPYSARNARLETLAELSLVRGMPPEMVSVLQPYVTVYAPLQGGAVSQVNINTAPKEVLLALDERIDERLAERIIEERRLKPFRSTSELSRISGLDTIAIGLIGKISVKGSIFRITAVAQSGSAGRTVEAVVRLSGSAPEYLAWQEY